MASFSYSSMRISRLISVMVIVVAVVVCAAGCGSSSRSPQAGRAPSSADPTSPGAIVPAAEAGGACQLLDYGVIYRAIGIQFAVAAAAEEEETRACLLRMRHATYPHFALSVTASSADEKSFQTVMAHSGSSRITGLGTVAYSTPISAEGDGGPGVQIRWLSASKQLMIARLRLSPKSSVEETLTTTAKVVDLVRLIEGLVGAWVTQPQ